MWPHAMQCICRLFIRFGKYILREMIRAAGTWWADHIIINIWIIYSVSHDYMYRDLSLYVEAADDITHRCVNATRTCTWSTSVHRLVSITRCTPIKFRLIFKFLEAEFNSDDSKYPSRIYCSFPRSRQTVLQLTALSSALNKGYRKHGNRGLLSSESDTVSSFITITVRRTVYVRPHDSMIFNEN